MACEYSSVDSQRFLLALDIWRNWSGRGPTPPDAATELRDYGRSTVIVVLAEAESPALPPFVGSHLRDVVVVILAGADAPALPMSLPQQA